MFKQVKQTANKLIYAQLLVLGILFIAWIMGHGFRAGASAILGGLCCVLPTKYFIYKVFSDKVDNPAQMLQNFYLGEMIKLGLSAGLLLVLFKFTAFDTVPVLTGFIGAYLTIWLIPLFIFMGLLRAA